ncbi:MAG: hypothetical protein H7123_07415 [Thermoleophilia bacterium]|nr:hypothetical protein [Thermoleophilia bacterium]
MLPVALIAGGAYAGKSYAQGTGGNENAGALAGAGVAIVAALALKGAGAGVRALLKSGEGAGVAAARNGVAERAQHVMPANLVGKISPDDIMYPEALLISRKIELARTGRLL